MNKKYISIGLILSTFTPIENNAASNSSKKSSFFIYEDSKQKNSFSLLDKSSVPSQRSRSGSQKSVQKLNSLDLEGKASRKTFTRNVMDMESVESIPVNESPSVTLSEYSLQEPLSISWMKSALLRKMRLEYINQETQTHPIPEKRDVEAQIKPIMTDQAAQQDSTPLNNTETQTHPIPEKRDVEAQIKPIMTDQAAQQELTPLNNTETQTHPIPEKRDVEAQIKPRMTDQAAQQDSTPLNNTETQTDFPSKSTEIGVQVSQKSAATTQALSQKKDQKTKESFTSIRASYDRSPALSSSMINHNLYSTHHPKNVEKVKQSSQTKENSEPVGSKNADIVFDINAFVTNLTKSLSASFSKMICDFNEMITGRDKKIAKKSTKEQDMLNEKSSSKKIQNIFYAMADQIREQYASLRKPLVDFLQSTKFLQSTSKRRRISPVESKNRSKYPNTRIRYRILGQDEQPIRSKTISLFRPSGKRVIGQLRRIAIRAKSLNYTLYNQEKIVLRYLKKLDPYMENVSFKRSRILTQE